MIRKMEMKDVDTIVKIDERCFPLPWNREQYSYELNENAFASLYVLCIDDEIIGYIDFWITFEICQLAKIAVLPEYRGKRFAHILMDQMIQDAQKQQCETISLEVRVSNTAAHHLYEAYDFIKVNVRKGYYQDNDEDGDVLVKALGGCGS